MAVCLALVAAFYLSFSVVTSHYDKKAKEYAAGDAVKEYVYLDSIATEKVWFGYTLKECREKEINLGLDLKGGMNVTMEVSVPDILRALSGYNTSETFTKAMAMAQQKQKSTGTDFVTLFIESYKEVDPNAQLASVFSTFELRDKVTLTSTNDEVEKVIRAEVDGAIANSFNVLRTRIDRFGVVQPNIQRLSQPGRILIELPVSRSLRVCVSCCKARLTWSSGRLTKRQRSFLFWRKSMLSMRRWLPLPRRLLLKPLPLRT